MPCLKPTECTGPNHDGPTCEVCYLRGRVAELEAENAALRQGIHPPTRPMPGGFSMENFMNGCTPEDISALCDALDREPIRDTDQHLTLCAMAGERDRFRATLESIVADCMRGADKLGMTPAGVQDIVDRINRALKEG